MSNSKLVDYTKISPNRTSPRNHAIDTITIHCVVGQCSVETLGNVFAPTSRQASSNYGVGVDGKIGMYCEEKDRSWCSSNGANDNRAITIEVASETTHPYKVNDKAYNALIELCADICKRNGIKELKWCGNKTLVGQTDKQNMTVHRWFANKSCPGDYLYNLHGQIATEVNKKLNGNATPPPTPAGTLYRVQVGAYAQKPNSDATQLNLKSKGYDTYMVQAGGLYKVQVGAYAQKANADAMAAKLKADGFDTFITTEKGTPVNSGTPTMPVQKVTENSRVKVRAGAKTYTGGGVASFVYSNVYTVDELKGNRAVLDANGICTPFNVSDLILV
ncbi:MAG: SPOR domain-containing protein [Oscillospiraceae bacterium]